MKRALAGLLVICAVLGGLATNAEAVVRKPHAGPIRVLLVGDSITASYQDRVAGMLGAGYAVTGVGVKGSSLLDTAMCNGSRVKSLVAQVDPDVVVAEYAGNYNPTVPVCAQVHQGDPKFFRKWNVAVRKNNNLLKTRGARVFWVLVPTAQRVPYAAIIPQLNSIYRTRAGANTVDAWTVFGGSAYDASLHVPDGLHLSPAGVERMATTIVAKVRG